MLAGKEAVATIAVKDTKVAQKFYEGTLGLTPVPVPEQGVLSFRSGRATILVYVLSVIHTLGAGSDAGTPWLRAQLVLTGAPILFLFVMRALPAAKVSAGATGARPGSAPSPAPHSARSQPSRSA